MPIILPSGFNITNTDPIDARFSVANQAARYGLAPANIYAGLLVYQQDEQSTYLLVDTANVANASGWQIVATGASAVSASYATTSSYSFYSVTSSFTLTSSLLTYQGTTARVSSNLSSIFLIQSGSNTVFNIDSTGSLTTSGSIISNTTGSFNNLLLIKNNNIEYLKVNGEGVLVLNQFTTSPTAISGGIYFDNIGNFFVGL